jgi:hypothetical protein
MCMLRALKGKAAKEQLLGSIDDFHALRALHAHHLTRALRPDI